MKKTRAAQDAAQEMTRLNRAAFRIGAGAVRGGRLDLLLDETLAQVFGGEPAGTGACTTFTCNMYAPG